MVSIIGWSDIYGLDMESPEDKEGFTQSAERVNHIIQQELDKGIPPNKIVVAGFSQGGALALHVALRSSHTLGGCIALSTWVPFRKEYPAALSSTAENLRVLQVHGDEDMVVSHRWGEGSHQLLKTMIKEPVPEFMTIEGMGHSSDDDEMAAVTRFLRSVFGLN